MLPAVGYPAILELEDDAAVNIQVLAVSLPAVVMNAMTQPSPSLAKCCNSARMVLRFALPTGRSRQTWRHGLYGRRPTSCARRVPRRALLEELGERVHVARVEGLVTTHPLLGSCDYYSHAELQPVHVGQTVGQPTCTLADMGDSVHAPGTPVARIPRQRFCPDTEEVTGSNPVSPTSKTPDQGRLAVLTPPPHHACLSICLSTARGEQPVHDRRARLQHRPQLVPVDQFSNRRAAVTNQLRNLLDRHTGI